MPTLIAEDLLLLLLDDESGRLRGVTSPDALFSGAILIDLSVQGLVRLQDTGSKWRGSEVEAVPDARTDDPVLAAALAKVADKPRSPHTLVYLLGSGVRDQLSERLAGRGILERKDGKVLGIFSSTTWPAADSQHEAQVRRQIGDALVRGLRPDVRTAALISLLAAANALGVIDDEGRSGKEIRARAKEIAEGDWASDAVSVAVRNASAAAMTAVMAGVSVATTSAISSGDS